MASVSGALWENLYYLYFGVAAVIGLAVVAWLFYNMWKFRWHPDRQRPADAPIPGTITVERGHPLWSYVMAGAIALIMFGLAFGTISAVNTIEQPPENEETIFIEVTGYQFGWKYLYQGEGGVPFELITPTTDPDKIPHFPVDRVVVFNITSQDVWHNFAIPDYRIRVDAIPGSVNPLWWKATQTGEVQNVCVVICGLNHARMYTMMDVIPQAEYDTWLTERSAEAFDALETRFTRDATRGTLVNATVDEATLDLSQTTVLAEKPIVLNVNNTGASPIQLTAGDRTIEVQPGTTGRLYMVAPASGTIEVTAAGQTRTLEVSA